MKSTRENVTMTIGQAAARFGLATHVLRHWESMGLVSPRRHGDRRRYTEDDLFRIAMVLRGKQAGLSLDDIADMYRAPDAAARDAILRGHQSALRRRIDESRAALHLIDHALACEHPDIVDCPRFREQVSNLIGPPAD